jgi:magnesium chelatase family protein
MDRIDGTRRPVSQFSTVEGLIVSRSAASFWVSPSSSRRRRTCSPRVRGSKSGSFGFSALSRIGTNCKRATRPCPCGYLGHPTGKCRCSPDQIARYRGRISGPLLDRIDLQIEVPSLPVDALPPRRGQAAEPSAAVRARVAAAATLQRVRQGKPNAQLQPKEIERLCRPDTQGEALLKNAFARLSLSARAYHRILKVARTIADLAAAEELAASHVAEAIGYRRLDRMRA